MNFKKYLNLKAENSSCNKFIYIRTLVWRRKKDTIYTAAKERMVQGTQIY